MIWRREIGEETWHFCKNCPRWPMAGDYEEEYRLPVTGQMCDECRAKKDRGECQVEPKPARPG
jgi:hypothetical protein